MSARAKGPAERSDGNLVLVHGWGMNAAVWEGLPESALAGLRPHPVELPGHGCRALEAGGSSLWGWADACLRDAPERAIWLGWSLGGLVALAAALRAPGRVSALVLMTTTPRFVRGADWTPAMPAADLEQFHASLAADPSATLARFLALQMRGSEHAADTLRSLRGRLATRPGADPAALSIGLDLLRDEDLRGPLPDIRCPTLWLFAERDTLVPAAVAERIEVLMRGARTHCIPGAAHAPFLSHPVETAAAMGGFLLEQPV